MEKKKSKAPFEDEQGFAVMYGEKRRDYSPFTAATPGSTLPSIASRRAPPPVEM